MATTRKTRETHLQELAPCVKKGAALLDRTMPGWRQQIKPLRLEMGSCSRCILGQLAGDFFDLAEKLSQEHASIPVNPAFWHWVEAHGFSCADYFGEDVLGALWIEEVNRAH